MGVHFQVVAYKELATFPSEWEVWKRLFQSVVSSQVWKSVLQVFKFQVSSVSKIIFCQCYKFQVKFQIFARKFFKCLRASCKGFVL